MKERKRDSQNRAWLTKIKFISLASTRLALSTNEAQAAHRRAAFVALGNLVVFSLRTGLCVRAQTHSRHAMVRCSGIPFRILAPAIHFKFTWHIQFDNNDANERSDVAARACVRIPGCGCAPRSGERPDEVKVESSALLAKLRA